jgi:hypothetical protein
MLGKSQEETLAVNSSYPVHILIKGQRLKFQCFGNSVFGTVLMRIGEIMSNPLCLVFISHMLMANSSPELHQILVFDVCIRGFAILNKNDIDCLLLAQFVRDKSSFVYSHIEDGDELYVLPTHDGSMYAIYILYGNMDPINIPPMIPNVSIIYQHHGSVMGYEP